MRSERAFIDAMGGHWVTIDDEPIYISNGSIGKEHIGAAAKHFGLSASATASLHKAHAAGKLPTDKHLYHSIAMAKQMRKARGLSQGRGGTSYMEHALRHGSYDQLAANAAGHPDPATKAHAQGVLHAVGAPPISQQHPDDLAKAQAAPPSVSVMGEAIPVTGGAVTGAHVGSAAQELGIDPETQAELHAGVAAGKIKTDRDLYTAIEKAGQKPVKAPNAAAPAAQKTPAKPRYFPNTDAAEKWSLESPALSVQPSPAERESMERYQSGIAFLINSCLRTIPGTIEPLVEPSVAAQLLETKLPYSNLTHRDLIENMDAMCGRASTPEPLVLYRGVSDVQATLGLDPSGGAAVGKVITDGGFISTSLTDETPKNFMTQSESPGCLFHVNVPAGSPVLAASQNAETPEAWSFQAEMIMPRSTGLKITHAYKDAQSFAVPIWHFECEPIFPDSPPAIAKAKGDADEPEPTKTPVQEPDKKKQNGDRFVWMPGDVTVSGGDGGDETPAADRYVWNPGDVMVSAKDTAADAVGGGHWVTIDGKPTMIGEHSAGKPPKAAMPTPHAPIPPPASAQQFDPEQAKDWLKANQASLDLSPSPEERWAVDAWCYPTYSQINDHLRHNKDPEDPGLLKCIPKLDDLMARGKAPEDLTAWRGVGDIASILGDDIAGSVGKTIQDKGYVAAAIHPTLARRFTGDAQIRIHIRKGQQCIFPGHNGEKVSPGSGLVAHEVLLPRGTELRITGASQQMGEDSQKDERPLWVIDAEVMPADAKGTATRSASDAAGGDHWVTIDDKPIHITGSAIGKSHIKAFAAAHKMQANAVWQLNKAHDAGQLPTDKELVHTGAIAKAGQTATGATGPIGHASIISALKHHGDIGNALEAAKNGHPDPKVAKHAAKVAPHLANSISYTDPGAPAEEPSGEGVNWVTINGQAVPITNGKVGAAHVKDAGNLLGLSGNAMWILNHGVNSGLIQTDKDLYTVIAGATEAHAAGAKKGQGPIGHVTFLKELGKKVDDIEALKGSADVKVQKLAGLMEQYGVKTGQAGAGGAPGAEMAAPATQGNVEATGGAGAEPAGQPDGADAKLQQFGFEDQGNGVFTAQGEGGVKVHITQNSSGQWAVISSKDVGLKGPNQYDTQEEAVGAAIAKLTKAGGPAKPGGGAPAASPEEGAKAILKDSGYKPIGGQGGDGFFKQNADKSMFQVFEVNPGQLVLQHVDAQGMLIGQQIKVGSLSEAIGKVPDLEAAGAKAAGQAAREKAGAATGMQDGPDGQKIPAAWAKMTHGYEYWPTNVPEGEDFHFTVNPMSGGKWYAEKVDWNGKVIESSENLASAKKAQEWMDGQAQPSEGEQGGTVPPPKDESIASAVEWLDQNGFESTLGTGLWKKKLDDGTKITLAKSGTGWIVMHTDPESKPVVPQQAGLSLPDATKLAHSYLNDPAGSTPNPKAEPAAEPAQPKPAAEPTGKAPKGGSTKEGFKVSHADYSGGGHKYTIKGPDGKTVATAIQYSANSWKVQKQPWSAQTMGDLESVNKHLEAQGVGGIHPAYAAKYAPGTEPKPVDKMLAAGFYEGGPDDAAMYQLDGPAGYVMAITKNDDGFHVGLYTEDGDMEGDPVVVGTLDQAAKHALDMAKKHAMLEPGWEKEAKAGGWKPKYGTAGGAPITKETGAPPAGAEPEPQPTGPVTAHEVPVGGLKVKVSGEPVQAEQFKAHMAKFGDTFSTAGKAAMQQAFDAGHIKTDQDLAHINAIAWADSELAGYHHTTGTGVANAVKYGSIQKLLDAAENGDELAAAISKTLGPTGLKSSTAMAAEKLASMKAEDFMHEKVAEASGSNKGGVFVGTDGVKRYVKQYKNPTQAYCEHVANSIYKGLGLDAPDSIVFKDGAGVSYASTMMKTGPSVGEKGWTKDSAQTFLKGFAADALLGNWDAVGTGGDNALHTPGGGVVRIDNGGSILHRAQGALKTAKDLATLSEWESMAAGGTSPDYTKAWKAAGWNKPEDIPGLVGQIDKLHEMGAAAGGWEAFVKKQSPGIGAAEAKSIGQVLTQRMALLDAKVQAIKTAKGASAQQVMDAWATAGYHQGQKAWPLTQKTAQAGLAKWNEWTAGKLGAYTPTMKQHIAGWQDGKYTSLSQALYSQQHPLLEDDEKVMLKYIDAAMNLPASEFQEDMIIHRALEFYYPGDTKLSTKLTNEYKALQTGDSLTWHGYAAGSFGTTPGYGSSRPFLFHILCPKGTRGVWVDGAQGETDGSCESEILLDRGYQLEIVHHEMIGHQHHITARIIPKDKAAGDAAGPPTDEKVAKRVWDESYPWDVFPPVIGKYDHWLYPPIGEMAAVPMRKFGEDETITMGQRAHNAAVIAGSKAE